MTSVADPAASTRGIVLVHARMLDSMHASLLRYDGADVELCTAQELATRVRDARKDGRPFVGVVGDDHDLHVAAEELAHSDTALAPNPGLEGASTRTTRTVDIGRVNGRCFLHHARVGLLPANVRELTAGPRLALRIDGRPARAWSVFVGNGCFGPGIDERSVRESTDEHLLDVRIVRGDGRRARVRPTIHDFVRRTCTTITIDVPGRNSVEVSLDGERLQLATPLRFECDADALRLLSTR
jgi:hypothetical protein